MKKKPNNNLFQITVEQPSELLAFLIEQVPGATRTKAKQWLSKQQVTIDQTITTQFNTLLQPGQTVAILRHTHTHELKSKYVRIVYEDRDLIVVDKAEGILSNTAIDGKENSVKRVLDTYLAPAHLSAHTVHRLDRYTSGLMLFAKNRDVQQILIDNWQDIIVDRRYVALVEGVVEREGGTVKSYLKDTKTFLTYSSPTDNGGKFAVTHYHVLKRGTTLSLVEFKLQTGRKNQIRVHMQDIGHPIVGDLKYSATTDPIDRVCLHACQLHFYHPVTGQLMHFSTPVPPVFEKVLKNDEREA